MLKVGVARSECFCSKDVVWTFTVIGWRSSNASRTEQRRCRVVRWSWGFVGHNKHVQKPGNDRYHSAAGRHHTAVGAADRQVSAVARKQQRCRNCYNWSRPFTVDYWTTGTVFILHCIQQLHYKGIILCILMTAGVMQLCRNSWLFWQPDLYQITMQCSICTLSSHVGLAVNCSFAVDFLLVAITVNLCSCSVVYFPRWLVIDSFSFRFVIVQWNAFCWRELFVVSSYR